MITITINVNDVNKRLDVFLLKRFSQLSRTNIYKHIRTNKIKLNDKKPEFNQRLSLYDVIKLYIDLDESKVVTNLWFTNSKMKLNIIFEDENILVLEKPIGIISQPGDATYFQESIQAMFLKYLYDQKQYDILNENIFVPSICHRLDRNTAGVMIAAKTAQALSEMNRIIKEQKMIKKYQCLVHGKITPEEAILRAYLYKDVQQNIVYINHEAKFNYKEIITQYKTLKSNTKYTWLEVILITGRTHQIRAHLNFMGYPLVGEVKYKSKNIDCDKRIKYQTLVCSELSFAIEPTSFLSYLNDKKFKTKDIWFKKYFE